MKTCIYTFSGTGTALAISDQVSALVGDSSVELIPKLLLNSAGKDIITEAQKIGFVFPNYFGGMPGAVKEFIGKLNVDNIQYIFAIVCAGGGQGYSIKFLQQELQQKGKKLNYGRYVAGFSNYIVASYYKRLFKSGKQREKVLLTLNEKTKQYAEEIKENKMFVEKSSLLFYLINRLLSLQTPAKIQKSTSIGDKEYSICERCNGCGICQNVCQANNILMIDNKPSFQHKCYRCMACLQYCPKNAILHNGKDLFSQKSFHPDFPAAEMIRRLKG
jgi:Pyruvate/2-oxoacid:ferredoxin oxidoreductase delta subunit/flavodoxin